MNRGIISAAAGVVIWVCGGLQVPGAPLSRQAGETIVLIGQEPAALAWLPARKPALRVRSTYAPGPGSIEYTAGRDYVVDYKQGTLRRTADSRLPDFRQNMLFGQEDFDHTRFPGFGNGGFFAYVDYSFARSNRWPAQPPQTNLLTRARMKLATGPGLKIVAFGDSITAGGDASSPDLIFWQRWVADLRRRYPGAEVVALNGATSGDSTVQAMQRLQSKVLDQKPDLVLIGFGMNDHNLQGVALPQFEQNLEQIIGRIRAETAAEVILFSAFPPNPRWKFGSHHMGDYAAATKRVASETACAYADVFNNWQTLAARKKPEDLLGNNINHPNDFGHWIYYRVLAELGL